MNRTLLLAALLFAAPLQAKGAHEDFDPLYAGTLLAYYPTNSAPGYLSVQPYVTATRDYATYNSHWAPKSHPSIKSIDLTLSLETGITQNWDVSLWFGELYNRYQDTHNYLFGDTDLLFGYQISIGRRGSWVPDARLILSESFPTGKYDHLNPKKGGSDISGSGSFTTGAILVLRKIFYRFEPHPFNINLNFGYFFSAPTRVHGFNAYGGGEGTDGLAKPRSSLLVNVASEVSLTQAWVVGLDIHYFYAQASRFSGKKGELINGLEPSVTKPAGHRFSLAPCIEYNFSSLLSIEAGVWFSVAGKNDEAFTSGLATVYYYF